MSTTPLANQHCQPRKGADHALDDAQIAKLLQQVDGWQVEGKTIVKTFKFDDFHRTVGFVNALAFFANREDHHPDLEVGYGRCKVAWSTHDVGGLSLNDFICAARSDALLA